MIDINIRTGEASTMKVNNWIEVGNFSLIVIKYLLKCNAAYLIGPRKNTRQAYLELSTPI
jgi:hypothetical protein